MKLLALPFILTTILFAGQVLSTDIEDPKTNADNMSILLSLDSSCDLGIDKASQRLLDMYSAEIDENVPLIHYQYKVFVTESNQAIADCKNVSLQIANELIDIQSDVEVYYKLNY